MWNTFVDCYTGNTGDDKERNVNKDVLTRKVEECRHAITAKAEVRASVEELRQETAELRSLSRDFTAKSKAKSKTFAFWEEYGRMVKLLLQFVKNERAGNWELHLLSVSAMVPYFFAMDRPNYSHWLPVYITAVGHQASGNSLRICEWQSCS